MNRSFPLILTGLLLFSLLLFSLPLLFKRVFAVGWPEAYEPWLALARITRQLLGLAFIAAGLRQWRRHAAH